MKKLLATLFVTAAASVNAAPLNLEVTQDDLTWLAKNIYFEARNQPTAGRIAVMMVTLNRVVSNKFPNSIQKVVTQGGTKLHRCQFSWFCDGKKDIIRDWSTYNDIVILVETMLPAANTITDITSGATFYHADYVNPKWSKVKKKIIQIGDHIFYK